MAQSKAASWLLAKYSRALLSSGKSSRLVEVEHPEQVSKRRARKKKRAKAANAPVADAKAPEEPRPSQSTVKFPAPPARLSRLVYLSCGFAAFQRDCDALVKSGEWRLTHAEGFNFFPGSDHVETLAVFDREETGAAFWEG